MMVIMQLLMVMVIIVMLPEATSTSLLLSSSSSSWAASKIPLKHIKKIRDLSKNSISITININNDTLHISRQQEKIYEYRADEHGGGGVHVLALHESTGHVMMARSFRTYQPADQLNLHACLAAVQPGRVLVVVGLPNFLSYLAPVGESALVKLGATMLPRVALGEPWAMVTLVGEELISKGPKLKDERISNLHLERSKVISEAVATRLQGSPERWLWLDINLVKADNDSGCKYNAPQLTELQTQFCQTYEGYGHLCHCDSPFIPHQQVPPQLVVPMMEEIPIVIVTANKPFYLYRILKNLQSVWGAGDTKVLVVVDGPNEETLHLAQLFQVETVIHNPQGEPGENTRTNMNIAFALYSVFSHWPHIDKAILLEDDLILAPDLLSYFHQTAPALTNDPTLFLVNAFGQNSYPSTASDPSTVLRADMYPEYGWMTCRRWVEYVLPQWVPPGSGRDWDWWIYVEGVRGNLQALVPEVSRTGHGGAAGAHVTGWEQHYYFNSRIITLDPTTILRHVERLESKSYSDWFENEIRGAKKVRMVDNPCHRHVLPSHEKGPFVLYLGVTSRSDGHNSFYLMQLCLGTEDQEVKELYEGVMRLRVRPYTPTHPVFKNISQYTSNPDLQVYDHPEYHVAPNNGIEEAQVLYLVGCPLSKYCKYSSGTSDWTVPTEPILQAAEVVAWHRKLGSVMLTKRSRVVGSSPTEDFSLNNLRTFHYTKNRNGN